jgi:adenylate cyclase, class 2
MDIEYEATFLDVKKDDMRNRLKKAGAKLMRPEYLQRRIPFHLPKEKRSKDAWLRVRDERDKITLSLKIVDGDKIENQKEICVKVNDFDETVKLLESIGCEKKSYQETKRELWTLDGVEITIDEWPFLEPFVEVEGKSEKEVRDVSEKIGFDYNKALFCAVGKLYQMKYGIHPDQINTTDKIVFGMKNPFLNYGE